MRLSALLFMLTTAAHGAESYKQVILPRIEGATSSYALAVNSRNEVLVGAWFGSSGGVYLWSEKGGYRTAPANSEFLNDRGELAGVVHSAMGNRIFWWSEKGGLREIAAPNGIVRLTGLNDAGEIAGYVIPPGSIHTRAFVATERGGVRFLLPESALQNSAARINERGETVGTMAVACAGPSCPNGYFRHMFLWTERGGVRETTPLPAIGPDSNAQDLDDLGQVVGTVTGINAQHVFLWTDRGGAQDLGCLSTSCSSLLLAGRGIIVGRYFTPLGTRSFVWTAESGMRDLGTLGGTQTTVNATNGRGIVVGRASLPPHSSTQSALQHAFVWTEETGIVDLHGGLEGESEAVAVNDKGVIVGRTYGSLAACIWIPVRGGNYRLGNEKGDLSKGRPL
jgi:uncharacterized membrane protein